MNLVVDAVVTGHRYNSRHRRSEFYQRQKWNYIRFLLGVSNSFLTISTGSSEAGGLIHSLLYNSTGLSEAEGLIHLLLDKL